VPVDELVRIGDPREVLLDLSATAAMLVLGSRGRGPIRTLLLGSTSVALVRQAACPVVVHRPVTDVPARHGVAVGVDASTESLTVLDFAFRQARLRDQPLTVVHARHFPVSTAPDDPYDEPPWAEDEQGASMTDRIEQLCQQYPDVTVKTVIRHGMPQHLLIDLAEHVGLLVVGVHHRGRAAELTFGSMAVWLVEHAECPVAAVPLSTEL
jgi:nucleotide-binding universal stress UspA family protein